MSDDMKTVEVPAKFKDLVSAIEKMSVLDLSELVKTLEARWAGTPLAGIATEMYKLRSLFPDIEDERGEVSSFIYEMF